MKTRKSLLSPLLVTISCFPFMALAQFPAERVLTDSTGRKLEGTVLSDGGDSIRIRRKSDGKEFDIALAKISEGDRAWLRSLRESAKPAPPVRTSPNPPPPVPVRPTAQPRPISPKLIPSKGIWAAQLKAGLVPPPRGWNALETTLRFKDGKQIEGYVYDVKDDRFWFAAEDMVQKSAPLDALETRCRLGIIQWRSRSIHAGSPSVALTIDGKTIHASIVAVADGGVNLLTEAGELMKGVPLAQLDTASRKFAEDWLAGSWEPKDVEWALSPKFTAAKPPFWNGHALVRHEGKWGLVDNSGKFVIAPTFDDVVRISDSSNLKLLRGDKWGLMADGGRIVLAPEWEDVGDLRHGMIPVRSAGKWGYAEDGGKLVIPCEWEDVWRFSLVGTAVVTRNGKRGFVDRSGNVIVKPDWDGAIMHSPEGVGAVRRGKGWALIDSRGKLLCEPVWNFRWAERRFDLGYIPAWPMEGTSGARTLLGIDGNPDANPKLRNGICLPRQPGPFLGVGTSGMAFTLTDKAGNEMNYDAIYDASGGFSAVRKGNLWGYADRNGLVLEPHWDHPGMFAQGLAAVTEPDGKPRSGGVNGWPWQFIDVEGKTVIPVIPKLGYSIHSSSKPWAPLMENGRIGARRENWREAWVDDRGRIFSDKQMELPAPGQWFPKAEEKNRIGLIDTNGKVLFKPEYEEFATGSSHWIGIKRDGKWGLADRTGQVEVKPDTTSQRGLPLVFPENGAAVIGGGNRQRIFWPDQTELKGTAEQKLQYVDEYGPDLVLKRGEGEDTEWWIARREPQSLWKLEGARRIYWNGSMVEFDRIWVEDKATKRWHFCSTDGKRLGPEAAEKPEQWFFDEGLGIMHEGNGCHFIDKDGQKAGVGPWEDARIFRSSMAPVKRDGRWGFIDLNGKLRIDCRYDEVGDFFVASRQRGDTGPMLAAVCLAGRWGYINPHGEFVIPLEHDMRGSWQYGKICFTHPERQWEIHTAYEPNGKRYERDPRHRYSSREPAKKHRYAGSWSVTVGDNGLRSLVSDAGVVALEPKWQVIVWVAPGVVAVRDKSFAGGLFSPEKGWLFQENDEQRILRDSYHGGFDHRFLTDELIAIESPPRWGYARYRK